MSSLITTVFVGVWTSYIKQTNSGFARYSACPSFDLQFFGNKSSGSFAKKNPSELQKMVSGNFHGSGGAKEAILKDLPADIRKQVGKNPDIYVNKDGLIQFVSTVKKGEVSFITDLNINWY